MVDFGWGFPYSARIMFARCFQHGRRIEARREIGGRYEGLFGFGQLRRRLAGSEGLVVGFVGRPTVSMGLGRGCEKAEREDEAMSR